MSKFWGAVQKDEEIIIKSEAKETKITIPEQSSIIVTLERGVRVYSGSNFKLMVENKEQPSVSLWAKKTEKVKRNEP